MFGVPITKCPIGYAHGYEIIVTTLPSSYNEGTRTEIMIETAVKFDPRNDLLGSNFQTIILEEEEEDNDDGQLDLFD
jgi:hypothetical protein